MLAIYKQCMIFEESTKRYAIRVCDLSLQFVAGPLIGPGHNHYDSNSSVQPSRKVFYVHVTVYRNKLFLIKPTRCTNFTNLFCHEILHVSDSSSVHHQEFIRCTLSNGICHTGL